MSLEIFYSDVKDQTAETCFWNREDNEPVGSGWFYWHCFPGCLPEGDPMGPFDTEDLAQKDAIENGYCDFVRNDGTEITFSIEPAPAAWACYFINSDGSGLSDEEIAEANAWADELGPNTVIQMPVGESYTGRFDRLVHCDLLDYVVMTTTSPADEL